MQNRPYLTVIICTYNRANILHECLFSLAMQTAALERFKVLLVNNNSTDNTHFVAKDFIGKLPGFEIVFEPTQGLSHARNRGLVEASTPWVAYLDDDAKACPTWVECILETIDKGDFDAFGGVYTAWHRFGPPPIWFHPDWETNAHVQSFYGLLSNGKHPSGGNCAYDRETVLRAGGFPAHLGMTGGKIAYGEETQLFQHMLKMGVRIGFVPNMRIEHCVLPYKYSLVWRLKSTFARSRDYSRAITHNYFYRSLALTIIRLAKFFLTLPIKLLSAYFTETSRHPKYIFIITVSPLVSEIGALVGLAQKKTLSK